MSIHTGNVVKVSPGCGLHDATRIMKTERNIEKKSVTHRESVADEGELKLQL